MDDMETKNRDNMRKVEEIEKQVWKIYDILKREGLGVDESHLMLLFLSLYNDNLLSKEFLLSLTGSESHQTVGEPASRYNNQQLDYQHVASSSKNHLSQFSIKGLDEIIQQVSKIDKGNLGEGFADVFESVLHQITSSQGRVGGDSMQPDELTQFMSSIVDLPKGAKVFNPFAGYASFALYLGASCEYIGQELNPTTWALGTLRLKSHNKLDSVTYLCDDSVLNWPNASEKFDLIVATPPFGMRLDNQHDGVDARIRRVEHFLIEKGISSLNEKGKLIALLPQSILSSGGQEQRLRKELIEKDLIDTIITLPGGLLLNTGIPLTILVIDKDKQTPGKVRFVDAAQFVDAKNLRDRKLNNEELISIVKKNYHDSENVRIIDNKQIEASDYNLNVARYFINVEGTKLGDMLTPVRGERSNLATTGKLIRIRDLSENKINFQLDVSRLEEVTFGNQPIRLIEESCLLIATVWKSSKPTLFEFTDTPIYLNSDILSFRINEKQVHPAYLIHELYEDYVVKQFNSYRTGGVIPRIRQKELLDIVIKLPSLEAQKEILLAEQSVEIKLLQKEQDKLVHGVAAKQFNELASLKHTLGTPRENISAWTENLIDFLGDKDQEFASLNKSFKDFYGVDMLAVLKEIRNDVNFMTDILEKGENSLQLNRYEKTQISLSDINDIIRDISSHNYNFNIKPLLLKGQDLKLRGIDGHKTPFKALLDNILTNAHKYGFDEKEEGNEVVFELKEVDDFLLFEIRNNGNPFPRNYDKEKFTARYSTADFKRGTGMGGYDINRIATEFGNPDWELMLNEDRAYPVVFKFQFSIKVID